MTTQVREEIFNLTQAETGITEADGTANVWSDIWKYQVPTGVAHVLRDSHTFSLYAEDGSAEVGNGTAQVQIEIRDQSEQDKRVRFGPSQYILVKDFTDLRKIAHLNVVEPQAIRERMFIVVMIKDDGTIDASDSYFNLEMIRVRNTL